MPGTIEQYTPCALTDPAFYDIIIIYMKKLWPYKLYVMCLAPQPWSRPLGDGRVIIQTHRVAEQCGMRTDALKEYLEAGRVYGLFPDVEYHHGWALLTLAPPPSHPWSAP